jgi:hypothetical protein
VDLAEASIASAAVASAPGERGLRCHRCRGQRRVSYAAAAPGSVVIRKTRFRKFSAGIYHTILKKAKSTFVPGFLILPNEQ